MLEVFASTGVAEDFTVMSVVGARAFKPAPPSYALVERAYPCWRTTLRLHCSMDSLSSVPNISVSRSPGSHMPKAFRHREIPMLGRGSTGRSAVARSSRVTKLKSRRPANAIGATDKPPADRADIDARQ